ncbi:SH3 domain-containing protein [Bacillus sp. 03113]|uniref:SH3 domain-containing protein n=1 Tax=Bacillus sp. 03113 TaxID=2578211 RepID=UPI0011419ED5|nr:SH3 domain-containing protein [Bacillus sp. 03113]
MKRVILPSFCFAVLSTAAFEHTVHAAQTQTPAKQMYTLNQTSIKYVSIQNNSNLNVRTTPSTNGLIIAKLGNGSEVTVYSEANGWTKINANGKEGYVSSQFLSAAKKTPAPVKETPKPAPVLVPTKKYVNVQAGSSLNMRTGATTSAQVIAKLSSGSEVSVISEGNGWARINANGKEGYVSSQFLSGAKETPEPVKETPKPAPPPVPTKKYVNVQAGSNLNLRNNPSVHGSIIVKLSRGLEVSVLSESVGWAKIQVYGREGYVSSSFLSTDNPTIQKEDPPKTSITKYVHIEANSSLNMHLTSSANGQIIAKLSRGDAVAVYSEQNGWAKVKVNEKEGYISTQYLSKEIPIKSESTENHLKESTKLVNVNPGSSLNMRNNPSINASIIIKLARGLEVTVLSESNGWSKIKAYGQIGYVNTAFLADLQINNSQESTPGNNSNDGSQGKPTENQGIIKYVAVNSSSSLNLRSEPSAASSILLKLQRGVAVTVHNESNGWSKVSVNGQMGYVNSQYISTVNPADSAPLKVTVNETSEFIDMTLDEMTAIQMKANPQTDKKYKTYIREDALLFDPATAPTNAIVKGSGWNVRGGAGTNYWVVGKIDNGEAVKINSVIKGEDGYNWYEINFNRNWVNASPNDVKYYLDANNFKQNPLDSFQFLKLSKATNLNATEVNDRILTGKGILEGKADPFIAAGNLLGINEMYLISHSLLETGNGSSTLANGVQINGRTVYNMYGIGAYDGDAIATGAQYAYQAGWFTPEAAIIGGASFISKGYIHAGQDTIYKMRWNPNGAITTGKATHQYATDIGWASKQVNQIYNLYSLLNSYDLSLDIPKYK